jgi:hypothetical protein
MAELSDIKAAVNENLSIASKKTFFLSYVVATKSGYYFLRTIKKMKFQLSN